MRVSSEAKRIVAERHDTTGWGSPACQVDFWERSFTRRRAVTVGAAALGVLALPRFAFGAPPSAGPNPIPGVLPEVPFIHIRLPGYPPLGSPDPATNDPITITDFNGHVGLAYVRGTGTRTNKATGATATLPFEVDLRFMKGEFVASDGRRRHGAFALI
ncbi:MAG TPA: hypothetical protein VFR38_18000 [Gaiellaceae bacterium]|nr:hypothetical protein [Gaiellaceae bacterium]